MIWWMVDFVDTPTDNRWLTPHFEKMAYDNGLLIEVYTKAFYLTKKQKYITIANNTVEFLKTKMMSKNLFFTASDADSKDGEGEYFVYDYSEVKTALSKEIPQKEVEPLLAYFGITKHGNFNISFDNAKSIVRYEEDKEVRYYKKMIKVLQKIREDREYPFIDNKIITSWNAMIIKSLLKISKNQIKTRKLAISSMDTLISIMYQNSRLYHSVVFNKKLSIGGYLEDYAYIISALIEAYQTSLQKKYLKLAVDLALDAISKFYTGKNWNFSIGEFVVQAKIFDGSLSIFNRCYA